VTELELSRRERKKEETKERICKAALKLFKQKGLDNTTIDEIAEKADVAKGTFFNYFPRKEAVLGFLPEMWIGQIEQEAEAIMDDPGREPVGPRITEIFVQHASFYEEDRTLAKWVAMEWLRCEQSGDDEMCRRWDDLGVRLIRFLQEKGELRGDVPPERAAEMFGAAHQSTVMRWVAAEEKPYALRDELRARMKLVVEGLSPSAGGKR
jgi:AcrR family transcriptional regulator